MQPAAGTRPGAHGSQLKAVDVARPRRRCHGEDDDGVAKVDFNFQEQRRSHRMELVRSNNYIRHNYNHATITWQHLASRCPVDETHQLNNSPLNEWQPLLAWRMSTTNRLPLLPKLPPRSRFPLHRNHRSWRQIMAMLKNNNTSDSIHKLLRLHASP